MAKNGNGNGTPVEALKDKSARQTLPELCAEYRRLAEEAATLKLVMEAVKEDIDVQARKTRLRKILGNGWVLLRIAGRTTRKISPELLMENGVTAEVIEESTLESVGNPHYQVRKAPVRDTA